VMCLCVLCGMGGWDVVYLWLFVYLLTSIQDDFHVSAHDVCAMYVPFLSLDLLQACCPSTPS
jgi:hypothetical protein